MGAPVFIGPSGQGFASADLVSTRTATNLAPIFVNHLAHGLILVVIATRRKRKAAPL